MSNIRQTPLTCSGHTRPVVHLAFSDVTDCGYFVISACKDGMPMLRQGDTGDWIGTFNGHKGAVWGVALNPEATKAATGAADFNAKVLIVSCVFLDTVQEGVRLRVLRDGWGHTYAKFEMYREMKLWDAITGEEICSFQHNHIVKSVMFSSDSNLLATGSNEKLIRVYDINRPDASPSKFTGHTAGIKDVAFLRGDSCLVSCADDKTMRVWDRNTGSEVQKVDFTSIPTGLEVSKDGSTLTVSHGCTVSFWDSNSLEKIREVNIPTQVNSASLHPDKTIFVCGGEDLKMYKFDYSNGCEIESFKGHFGPVHCVRFSPDGELYASGSEDGTLRLWQTTVGKTYGLWKCVDSPESIVLPKTEVPTS